MDIIVENKFSCSQKYFDISDKYLRDLNLDYTSAISLLEVEGLNQERVLSVIDSIQDQTLWVLHLRTLIYANPINDKIN